MTVALRALRPDERERYAAASAEGYARQMVEHGGLPEEAARAKSTRDTERLLSSDAAFFAVEADGVQVGFLVMGERERDGGVVAFVYDITVAPEHRGSGIGRRAMLLAEDEARARGHARIELNVFGGNAVARGLYGSLGYREMAVTMAKDLA